MIKIVRLWKGLRSSSRRLKELQDIIWVLHKPFESKAIKSLEQHLYPLFSLTNLYLFKHTKVQIGEAIEWVWMFKKPVSFEKVYQAPKHHSMQVLAFSNHILPLSFAAHSLLLQPLPKNPK